MISIMSMAESMPSLMVMVAISQRATREMAFGIPKLSCQILHQLNAVDVSQGRYRHPSPLLAYDRALDTSPFPTAPDCTVSWRPKYIRSFNGVSIRSRANPSRSLERSIMVTSMSSLEYIISSAP